MHVVLENPIQRLRFPAEGEVIAVMDTGYEGFLAVPREVFHALGLDTFRLEKRTLSLADGSLLNTARALGKLMLPRLNFSANGFYETYSGLEEIILGVEGMSWLRILLDYCSDLLRLEACP